jgi:hypothetical protein
MALGAVLLVSGVLGEGCSGARGSSKGMLLPEVLLAMLLPAVVLGASVVAESTGASTPLVEGVLTSSGVTFLIDC